VVGAVDESGWPLLPDAANLVEVGRALVMVRFLMTSDMNAFDKRLL
jgi:hypothetical protein